MKPLLIVAAVVLAVAWPHLVPVFADVLRVLVAAEAGTCVLLARLIWQAARGWPYLGVYPWRAS